MQMVQMGRPHSGTYGGEVCSKVKMHQEESMTSKLVLSRGQVTLSAVRPTGVTSAYQCVQFLLQAQQSADSSMHQM